MEEGFYRRLWRFNAIVIAVVGVIGLVGLAALVVVWVYTAVSLPRGVADRTIGPATADDSRLVLGYGQAVPDTGLLVFRIGRGSSDANSYSSSYREGDDRNILIINQRDGSSRRILPDNSRQITEWQSIGGKDDGVARAYVALVMAPATGNRATALRSGDVLVGNFRTGKQAWIAKGVRSLADASLVDDDSVAVTTVEADRLMFRRIDLSTLQPRVAQAIPTGDVSTQGRLSGPEVEVLQSN